VCDEGGVVSSEKEVDVPGGRAEYWLYRDCARGTPVISVKEVVVESGAV